ncbi:hypothetical protein PENTCL1PPCAC_26560 [Pristionchus entomophagus]|uniref:histone acetyltransferase n=1 Tax=Pristionchus entomophagus TaxID=358040 RepID=A0AAV5UD75_9BILA|nr:hypothetical protein PENTCL1PPCAC_26560 [Pristionchus entomophagus]
MVVPLPPDDRAIPALAPISARSLPGIPNWSGGRILRSAIRERKLPSVKYSTSITSQSSRAVCVSRSMASDNETIEFFSSSESTASSVCEVVYEIVDGVVKREGEIFNYPNDEKEQDIGDGVTTRSRKKSSMGDLKSINTPTRGNHKSMKTPSREAFKSDKKNEEKKFVELSKKEEENKNIGPRDFIIFTDGSWSIRAIIRSEQHKDKDITLSPLKFKKESVGENERKRRGDLSDDDRFEPDRVNPDEEYSEKYYKLMKSELMERMGEKEANQIVQVHKKTHEKRLTVDDRLQWIVLGCRYEMEVPFDGVYPEYYSKHETLWICDGCFSYYADKELCVRHRNRCRFIAHPPGEEVYRDKSVVDGVVSVFKVRGDKWEDYCRKLCMLAMLFVQGKCVYLDVDEFDFFIVTQFSPDKGMRPVGYFSKQRTLNLHQNLACFCVFPCYQKKGFGRFIIDFSYQLSRLSGIPGGPERPLSPFGLVSYTSYWKRTMLLRGLEEFDEETTVNELVNKLGMRENDVVEVIQNLFSTKLKKGELNISKEIVHNLIAKEKVRDANKLYTKMECFDPEFHEYMLDFKSRMQRSCRLNVRDEEKNKKETKKERKKRKDKEKKETEMRKQKKEVDEILVENEEKKEKNERKRLKYYSNYEDNESSDDSSYVRRVYATVKEAETCLWMENESEDEERSMKKRKKEKDNRDGIMEEEDTKRIEEGRRINERIL